MHKSSDDRVICITHLRDCLGIAYLHVVRTDEPVVVKRYGRCDAMLVPAWEWRWLKELEAGIQAGNCPVGRERGEACPCSLSG